MRSRNAVTRFVMVLILLIVTLCVSVLPGAAKNNKKSGKGCLPTYWRHEKAVDEWVSYTPNTEYEDVFAGLAHSTIPRRADFASVLRMNGGGEEALARHAVAALLNAAKFGDAYPYLVDGIINIVQGADASGDFKTAKDLLKAANNADCPLK